MRKLWRYERLLLRSERSSSCALMMESASPIRDDVDFNQFIHDLEGSPHGAGMTNVKANRIITVSTKRERLQTPMDA